MIYPHAEARIAGVLVPLASLRSEASAGCGEFADLPALARWSSAVGLKLIQLLPVNDTGGQSSPYDALSAHALHPMYLRLDDLPELAQLGSRVGAEVREQIARLRTETEGNARFFYPEVVGGKLMIARRIYDELSESIIASRDLTSFVQSNPWVQTYAVFRTLKEQNEGLPWRDWQEYRDVDADLVERLWKRDSFRRETHFWAWLQSRLAEQFEAAAAAVAEAGVALKGDIPILMNEDSADVWLERDIFELSLRAGAPPDMFSELGQNWGFPTYNWQRLAERTYDWWRTRIRNAARYYHAYRIDHVLGFFRIWAVPRRNWSGIPGFFWPQRGISTDALEDIGFDAGRVRWLAEPHVEGAAAREALGEEAEQILQTAFTQIGDEDLYLFAQTIGGEQDIADLGLAEEQREWLLAQYRDRALLALPDGTWAPSWTFRSCTRYGRLHDHERERFEDLVSNREYASNQLWAAHGRAILSMMLESSDMLACAEDLGVVPEAVPRVLEELGILGLRIPRWAHYWEREGQPAIPFHEYGELSVCAASVHDTSTLRGWWELENGREELWHQVGGEGPCPEEFSPAVARLVLRALMRCASRIVVLALQDLLTLAPELLSADPNAERVNVPGTYNDFNWTWRMPLPVEQLAAHAGLTAEIRGLTHLR